MDHELAQVNIGRLVGPIDGPQLASFVAQLDPINALADAAPGFRWRLQTEDGNATSIQAFEWDIAGSAGVIMNMSVWSDVASLAGFVYGPMHREILRRRRQWFVPMPEAYTCCWWVPAGHRPSTDEAEDRIRHIRRHGVTPYAFTMREHFPPPGPSRPEPIAGDADWLCPA